MLGHLRRLRSRWPGGRGGCVRHGHVGARSEVLRRTRVISSLDECEDTCRSIVKQECVVGIDLEGINSNPPGLIQLAVRSNEEGLDKEQTSIYLMRTGQTPSMLSRTSSLTNLLESEHVIKVVHAMSVDCKALIKAGVRPWSLVDTAIAHKHAY